MIEGRTLLIVDDDPATRFLMEELCLQGLPSCTFEMASNADEAYAICVERGVDCVLVDYRLPGEDGISLSARLRARFAHLPIVLCTGMGDELIAKEAIQAGVNDYIPKAVLSPPAIARAVSNAIRLADRMRIIDAQRTDIETFAFALAHDFKQPVRQLKTYSGLLSECVAAGNREEIDIFVGFIDQAANRLDHLIDVLSDYSLLHKTPVMTTVSVETVVEEVCADLNGFIEEHEATVGVVGGAEIWGNAALVRQIVQNLVVNAVKYNRSAVPSVTIDIAPGEDDADVVICVRDNGIGIEARHIDYIFAPLARLHIGSEFEGAGLGLTLVRKAVLTMRGTIACRSTPGSGSEFIVTLPAETPQRGEFSRGRIAHAQRVSAYSRSLLQKEMSSWDRQHP